VLVRVELANQRPALEFSGEPGNRWRDRVTWPTPFSPEINDDRDLRRAQCRLEFFAGQLAWFDAGHTWRRRILFSARKASE
jgi:hypothetical protein